DGIHAVEHRPRQAKQHLAIVGQAELARRAMKQSHSKVLFKLGNLASDRGLAELALTRHGRERARLHHADERSKRTGKVHGFPRITQRSFKEMRSNPSDARGIPHQYGRSAMPMTGVAVRIRKNWGVRCQRFSRS